jgi:predicted amidophosphoribosyltransferase
LVRCYWKKRVGAYRVELELHGQLLNKSRRGKEPNYKFDEAPDMILPSGVHRHVRFVQVRWRALERHLVRRFGRRNGIAILEQARVKADVSLQAVTRFLRRQGVNNAHRFLAPMRRINKVVEHALLKWQMDFRDQWNRML